MTGLRRFIMCLGCIVIVIIALYPPRIFENGHAVAPRGFAFSNNFYQANYEEWDHKQEPDGSTSYLFHYDAVELDVVQFVCELIIVFGITGFLCCLTANRRSNHRQQLICDTRDG